MKWICLIISLNILFIKPIQPWPFSSLTSSLPSSLVTLPPLISPQYWLARSGLFNRPSISLPSNDVFIPKHPLALFNIQSDPNFSEQIPIEFEDDIYDENLQALNLPKQEKSSPNLVQAIIDFERRSRNNLDYNLDKNKYSDVEKVLNFNRNNLKKKQDKSSFDHDKIETELIENQVKSPVEISRHTFASSNGDLTLVTTMKYPHETTSEYSPIILPQNQIFAQLSNQNWNNLLDAPKPIYESSSNREFYTNNPLSDSINKHLDEFNEWSRQGIIPDSLITSTKTDQSLKSSASNESNKEFSKHDENHVNSKSYTQKGLEAGAIVGIVMGSLVCVTLLAGIALLVIYRRPTSDGSF